MIKRAQNLPIYQICDGVTYSTFIYLCYKTWEEQWYQTTYMSQLLMYKLHKLLASHAIPEKHDNDNEKNLDKVLTALQIII